MLEIDGQNMKKLPKRVKVRRFKKLQKFLNEFKTNEKFDNS